MTSTTTPPEPHSTESRTLRVGGLDIAFDDRVLRPRAWTSAQSQWAAELLDHAPPGPVLELCTGAGHIGLLTIVGNGRHLVAVDADPVACDYARRNAATAGLAERVEVRHAMLEDALAPDELFPVIVADPPWVPTARTTEFPEDPLTAIDGGTDGLAIARRCLEVARAHLVPGGAMLLQLGSLDQARELQDAVDEGTGLAVTEVRRPAPNGVVVCVRRTG
jgi:methylase of polypeptide subunit release factors